MATTLKKCLKLQKLFASEKDGSQVLSSLANVSQRLPTLLQAADSSGTGTGDAIDVDVDDAAAMGVLSFSSNTRTLLVQKHFLALEKSRVFLSDILRDYQELLRRLRSFTGECVTLVDDALIEGESAEEGEAAMAFPVQLLEWMETVLAMFEHEVLRKTRLVADLEYSDSGRLSAVHKQWSARGAMSNVDYDYGLQLPQAKRSPASESGESETASITSEQSQKSKKKNKNKKNKSKK
ncbi:hypothetical protein BBJ28_00021804 [Nothophytophthora sp. Chile5]|nr:hypothetical protein BBJ28_00021804 [Nothophytophthora sp. Chile5]